LLGDNAEGALDGALNFGRVASYLPNDPAHILLTVNGNAGLSLFKVDVNDGVGVLVEKPRQRIEGWWLDLDGNAVLRMEYLNGTIRILRHETGDEWAKVLSYRPNESEEHPDYELLGPSDQPGRFYVLARPEGKDRRGIYLYDVARESFGDVLYEHPVYDLESGRISRDGKRVVSYCYVVHVYTCQFIDPKIESHMRGVRKFFGDTVNVHLIDSSADDKTIVFLVTGPGQAPTYFYYRVDQARIEPIGLRRDALNGRPLPSGSVVKWKARDGVELSGYLIRPPGAEKAVKMPLVVMPHGGPEARDRLDFDPWTQSLAAQGYAVFQPNFRGSDGFGKAFKESGWGEWGGKMQDDITDGVEYLVKQGIADPKRVCIYGASYGGYATLAGLAYTPDLYACGVDYVGVSNLFTFLKTIPPYWKPYLEMTYEMVGNPEKDKELLTKASPALNADRIKAPLLIAQGARDPRVNKDESDQMVAALRARGVDVPYIVKDNEGHGFRNEENQFEFYEQMERFLDKHLGPKTN